MLGNNILTIPSIDRTLLISAINISTQILFYWQFLATKQMSEKIYLGLTLGRLPFLALKYLSKFLTAGI